MYRNIQKACKDAGKTIIGIERELGLSRGSICKWDQNIPSVIKVAEVAKLLEVPIETLLRDSDDEQE
jgi:transcriptional regulator with XRE-family HTH domain